MSKDTVSAERFFADNKKRFWGFGPGQAVWEFADALSQHNTEALEAKRNELAAWKQSAMAQLVKADKLREVLTEQSKYLGWDMYEAVADYVSALKAELSALRGKETEPLGTCDSPNPVNAPHRQLPLCVNWKPIVQNAPPRKHTTWTEVKAEMDAPPVALPTEEEERAVRRHIQSMSPQPVNTASYIEGWLARARRPLSLTTEKEK